MMTKINLEELQPVEKFIYKKGGDIMEVETWDIDQILNELELREKKEIEEKKKQEEAKQKGVIDGVVEYIKTGKYSDFLTKEAMDKLDINPEIEAVQIKAVNERYGITVVETMKKSLHEKAKFRRFANKYIKNAQMQDGKVIIQLTYDMGRDRWKIYIPE